MESDYRYSKERVQLSWISELGKSGAWSRICAVLRSEEQNWWFEVVERLVWKVYWEYPVKKIKLLIYWMSTICKEWGITINSVKPNELIKEQRLIVQSMQSQGPSTVDILELHQIEHESKLNECSMTIIWRRWEMWNVNSWKTWPMIRNESVTWRSKINYVHSIGMSKSSGNSVYNIKNISQNLVCVLSRNHLRMRV